MFLQNFTIGQPTTKNPMETKCLKVLQLSKHLHVCRRNLRTKKNDRTVRKMIGLMVLLSLFSWWNIRSAWNIRSVTRNNVQDPAVPGAASLDPFGILEYLFLGLGKASHQPSLMSLGNYIAAFSVMLFLPPHWV